MPRGRAKAEIVPARYVPEDDSRGHGKPADHRMSQTPSHALQPVPREKRAEPFFKEAGRQAAQQRQDRLSHQDQRRRYDDQQQMLHHVRHQQQIAEGVERRSERDEGRCQASQIRDEAFSAEAFGRLAMESQPAANTQERREREQADQARVEAPRREDCFGHTDYSAEGLSPSPGMWTPGAAIPARTARGQFSRASIRCAFAMT